MRGLSYAPQTARSKEYKDPLRAESIMPAGIKKNGLAEKASALLDARPHRGADGGEGPRLTGPPGAN